ncbi:MAG: hypothetical protein ABFC71_09645 [Methanoregula sp.]
MNTPSRLETGLIMLIILVVVIPICVVTLVSTEVPYFRVPGEPVHDAALASNITITRVENTTWNLPGATGGKIYVLSDNSGGVTIVDTQAFDSAESRDAAIRLYHANLVGHGRPVGRLFVIGQHLVYVIPADSEILHRLAPGLKAAATP